MNESPSRPIRVEGGRGVLGPVESTSIVSSEPNLHDPVLPVHVSMAVDRGFEAPLAVALLSLAETHARTNVPCDVSVLYSGLSADVLRTIESDVAGRLTLQWIEVDLQRLAGARYTVGLSNAALFRILLPELLPNRDRTIYLDADTLVRSPLDQIWLTELGDHDLLGAVRDAGSPFAAGPSGTDWRTIGLPPDTPYFNSGLLVLPLERWRQEGSVQETLDILRGAEMRWGDQDALNLVARSRWRELPRRWNLQTADAEGRSLSWALWRNDVECALDDPAIIHYTESIKPWTGKDDHPFGALWFETLGRSSWAGWQSTRPSAPTRVRRRVTRAARVLIHG